MRVRHKQTEADALRLNRVTYKEPGHLCGAPVPPDWLWRAVLQGRVSFAAADTQPPYMPVSASILIDGHLVPAHEGDWIVWHSGTDRLELLKNESFEESYENVP